MPDRIEQQIVINAPLDRVWDLVSVPGWWVPTEVATEPDRTPGSQTVRESARWGRFPVEVVEIRPQSYAAFRWASQAPGPTWPPATPRWSSLRGGCRRRGRRDRGGERLQRPGRAGAGRQNQLKDNTGGWSQELGSLRARAEEPAPA